MAASDNTLSRRLLIAAVVLFVALGLGIDWWRRRARPPAPAPAVRLTSGAGLATEPAISPDGSLVAYASDRGSPALAIWVQPRAGGAPRRLTTSGADSHSPSFSPDGASIVYRSEEGAGSVCVVPASGGAPRVVAHAGRDPRFSPDGKQLAYWVRETGQPDEVRVVASSGGESRRICPECAAARFPLWSPDGRHLVFLGDTGRRWDWYAAPLDGGPPVRTGAQSILHIQDFRGDLVPTAWVRDAIFFTGQTARGSNIWRMPIAPPLYQCAAGAVQVTAGAGYEASASAADGGAVVYAVSEVAPAVWSLPLPSKRGAAPGEPEKLADGSGERLEAAVTADGRLIAFRRGDDIWVRELATGQERALHARDLGDSPAVISPDGATVVYGAEGALYSIPVAGGEPERIVEHAGHPLSWSPDGKSLLCQGGRRSVTLAYPSSEERPREILHDPDGNIYEPRFSPDGRWIAFHTGRPRPGREVWIVPFRPGPEPKESDWIHATEDGGSSRNPVWSPDGNTLYYLSERDGFRCIWAQPLDRAKHPRGKPFAMRHFHQARRGLRSPRDPLAAGLAAAPGKLLFTAFETTGNIWAVQSR